LVLTITRLDVSADRRLKGLNHRMIDLFL
jgi:hypothetical protein